MKKLYFPLVISILIFMLSSCFALVQYEIGDDPNVPEAGDINNDGWQDLLVTFSNYEDHSISVLTNYGDGSFYPEVKYVTPGYSFEPAIAEEQPFQVPGGRGAALAGRVTGHWAAVGDRGS